MKINKIKLILICFIGLVKVFWPGTKTLLLAEDLAVPFARGEKINYVVKWGFIVAGRAFLSVEPQVWNGKDVYRIYSAAHSSGLIGSIYPVKDKSESIVSQEDFSSLSFYKYVNEGKYHQQEQMTFDQVNGKVIYPDGAIDITKGTVDILASLYVVRLKSLEPGKEFTVKICNNKKNYELVVRVITRETVTVPAGEFNTIVVEPLLKQEGIFMHQGRLFVYLTDDQERIPVLLRSKIAVGSIIAAAERIQRY
ncbi:MAG: DUF3108 domain-containing protein [Elusimicrobia bacterium]|nr:DUF3108 domain-containing protein [Elusimicrobiota bacterium]